VMDVVDNPTLSKSTLALPSSSFAETEGTLVSSEGRAQRHYPVYLPTEQRHASWQWLNTALASQSADQSYEHFDDISNACAGEVSLLSRISEASPDADFRSRGVKIPRQTHRYSGRTAMRADISVHEPKQPQDPDSPLAFTMEGDNKQQPGALLPFVWSPGWNSNQSLHKFQSEVGGALEGGTAGIRLIEASASQQEHESSVSSDSEEQIDKSSGWRLLPLYRIFGSEELSVLSPAINELACEPFIQLSTTDAAALDARDGDTIELTHNGSSASLKLDINPSIPQGCAGYSVGVPGAPWIEPNSMVSLRIGAKKSVSEGANV